MAHNFDSRRSVFISLYMVLTGYAVLVGIPVISTAWVTKAGFSQAEAGALAAADLGGFSLGAILCAIIINRIDRRHLVIGAALLAAWMNTSCVFVTDHNWVLMLRLITGIASGVYTAVAVASLGAHSNPSRAYSWVLFAFAVSQAFELSLLPELSMHGIYTLFACSYALSIPFSWWVVPRAVDTNPRQLPTPRARQTPAYIPWLVLTAILFAYINIGAYWTYIELASLDSNASPDRVGHVLVLASVFSILGCLVAAWINDRFGLTRPLTLTLLAQALTALVLVKGIDDTTFTVSVLGFNFLWMLSDILQLTVIAKIDPTGRYAALVPGAQGIGQIIGPTAAAALLASQADYRGVFTLCALAATIAALFYAMIALGLRQSSGHHTNAPL